MDPRLQRAVGNAVAWHDQVPGGHPELRQAGHCGLCQEQILALVPRAQHFDLRPACAHCWLTSEHCSAHPCALQSLRSRRRLVWPRDRKVVQSEMPPSEQVPRATQKTALASAGRCPARQRSRRV